MAISRRLHQLLLLLLAAALPFDSLAEDAATLEPDMLASGGDKKPYEPIENLDESAYLGVWLQAYASASVVYTFELGGNCVTATYSATDKERTIKVLNQVRPFGDRFSTKDDKDRAKEEGDKKWFDWDYWFDGLWDGFLENLFTLDVNGFLSQSPEVDGQGTVELQPGPLPLGIGTPDIDDVMYMEPGNYWIMELGPKENDQYQYAIVTDGNPKVQCYILVRNVAEFEERWEAGALWQLKEWGFTGFTNKPLKTNQENCGYDFEHPYEDDEYYDDEHYDDYYSKDSKEDDW